MTWEAVGALLLALAALITGIATQVNSASKLQVEALRGLVDDLRKAQAEQEKHIAELEAERTTLWRAVNFLIGELERAGLQPRIPDDLIGLLGPAVRSNHGDNGGRSYL